MNNIFIEGVVYNKIDILSNISLVELKNININQIIYEDSKSTALHIATNCGYDEIVKFLIKNDAFLNPLDEYDMTPIHLSVYRERAEIFRMLIQVGADINIRDGNYDHPLHTACINGNITYIKNILANCSNICNVINITNYQDRTPLHIAAKYNRADTCVFLIQNGASVAMPDIYNCLPLELANEKTYNYVLDSCVK